MVDNSSFLKRVYELYGTDEPVALAPLLGYKSANAVRNLQKGKNPPGETVLLRIKVEKSEDLRGLVQVSGAPGVFPQDGPSLRVQEAAAYEADDTARALRPYLQMLRTIYDARDNPKHGNRWPALAENIVTFYERVTGKDSSKILNGRRERRAREIG
jgi:hypothetical protein